MSIDCRISLPCNVRIRAVAKVLAALLGHPGEKMQLPGTRPSWAASFPIVKLKSADIGDPSVAWIEINDRMFLFHFELRGGRKGILLPKSHENIRLFKALADFFGGKVDFDDCDDVEFDYIVKDKKDEQNCPEDGEAWTNLQERFLAIKPLKKSRKKVA